MAQHSHSHPTSSLASGGTIGPSRGITHLMRLYESASQHRLSRSAEPTSAAVSSLTTLRRCEGKARSANTVQNEVLSTQRRLIVTIQRAASTTSHPQHLPLSTRCRRV